VQELDTEEGEMCQNQINSAKTSQCLTVSATNHAFKPEKASTRAISGRNNTFKLEKAVPYGIRHKSNLICLNQLVL